MINPWHVLPEHIPVDHTEEELAELIKRGPRAVASVVTPEQVSIYQQPAYGATQPIDTLTPVETRAKWMDVYATVVSLLPSKEAVVQVLGDGDHNWFSLREMRTIRLGAGRQNGKTQCLVSLLKEHPRAVLLVKNQDSERSILMTQGNDAPELSKRIWATGPEPILNIEHLLEQLSWASHILIDDATLNQGAQGLVYQHQRKVMPDVILVMMG